MVSISNHAQYRLITRYKYKKKEQAVYNAFKCDVFKECQYHKGRVLKLYNGYVWVFEDELLITVYKNRFRFHIKKR